MSKVVRREMGSQTEVLTTNDTFMCETKEVYVDGTGIGNVEECFLITIFRSD